MMLDVSLRDADFMPMAEFSLRWRWTDPQYDQLPSDILATIKPLQPKLALDIWVAERSLLDQKLQTLSTKLFYIEKCDASHAPELTRQWLIARLLPPEESIIVTWQPEEAVVTRVSTFIQYWDTFCYPGADDTTVWPRTQSWGLLFHHEEEFHFGRWRIEEPA